MRVSVCARDVSVMCVTSGGNVLSGFIHQLERQEECLVLAHYLVCSEAEQQCGLVRVVVCVYVCVILEGYPAKSVLASVNIGGTRR